MDWMFTGRFYQPLKSVVFSGVPGVVVDFCFFLVRYCLCQGSVFSSNLFSTLKR